MHGNPRLKAQEAAKDGAGVTLKSASWKDCETLINGIRESSERLKRAGISLTMNDFLRKNWKFPIF